SARRLAAAPRLRPPLRAGVASTPAGEGVLGVPLALAVAQQHQCPNCPVHTTILGAFMIGPASGHDRDHHNYAAGGTRACTATPESIRAPTSGTPQSASASRVCSPGYGGGVLKLAGVAEKRGAGAGWATPYDRTNVPLAASCGCVPAAASDSDSTGATQASEPSKTASHSARVRVAMTAAIRSLTVGHRAASYGSLSPRPPRPSRPSRDANSAQNLASSGPTARYRPSAVVYTL